MNFLAIDIGNTRLKWSLFDKPKLGSKLIVSGAEFLENIHNLSEKSWQNLPIPKFMLGCNVASEMTRKLLQEQIDLIPAWNLNSNWLNSAKEESGVINNYENPSRLGSDRFVALIGARNQVLHNLQELKPVIVVMVGTAVTIDALDENGNFLGGIILPGHGIMLKAMENGTAGLNVPTGIVNNFPKNTSDALTSGGTFAIVGAINQMYQNLFEKCQKKPICILTGGAAWKISPYLNLDFQLIENLIFNGLLIVAEKRFLNKL